MTQEPEPSRYARGGRVHPEPPQHDPWCARPADHTGDCHGTNRPAHEPDWPIGTKPPSDWPDYVSPTSFIVRATLTPSEFIPLSPSDIQALPPDLRAEIAKIRDMPIPAYARILRDSHVAEPSSTDNSPHPVHPDTPTKIPEFTPSADEGAPMTVETPEESRIKSLNGYERETVVTAADGDDTVRIWSAQRRYISRLRANPKAVETGTGFHGSTEWASFEIPAADWNPATGIKRNAAPMTEEQKIQARANLAKGRQTQEQHED